MGWCLSCHRAPEKHLRPIDEVTNLDWDPADENRDEFYTHLAESAGVSVEELKESALSRVGIEEGSDKPMTQREIGLAMKDALGVNPPVGCAARHR